MPMVSRVCKYLYTSGSGKGLERCKLFESICITLAISKGVGESEAGPALG